MKSHDPSPRRPHSRLSRLSRSECIRQIARLAEISHPHIAHRIWTRDSSVELLGRFLLPMEKGRAIEGEVTRIPDRRRPRAGRSDTPPPPPRVPVLLLLVRTPARHPPRQLVAVLDHAPGAGDLDQDETDIEADAQLPDAPGRMQTLAGPTPWHCWAGDGDAWPNPEDGDRPAAYAALARLARDQQNSAQLPAGR